MDLLKKSYDRILLLAVGFFLLFVSLYALTSWQNLEEEHTLPSVRFDGARFEPNQEVLLLQSEADKITSPAGTIWDTDSQASLFVSRVYLLRKGDLVDIFDSDTELYPGIPNSWILEHKLDFTDSRLGDSDSDNDGFTNLEEFRTGTNPSDATSKPPVWTKLRMKSFEKIPFRIKFMGAPAVNTTELASQASPGDSVPFPEGTEFSINTIDFSSPTQFKKVGDIIDGTGLKIISARAKSVTLENGLEVDQSELTVVDQSTGDEIILVNQREVDSPYSFALLDYPITGQEIRVERGRTFVLPGVGETYKLIDVNDAGAIITPIGSEGQRLTVPRQQ
jgi:hypothetical protein